MILERLQWVVCVVALLHPCEAISLRGSSCQLYMHIPESNLQLKSVPFPIVAEISAVTAGKRRHEKQTPWLDKNAVNQIESEP